MSTMLRRAMCSARLIDRPSTFGYFTFKRFHGISNSTSIDSMLLAQFPRNEFVFCFAYGSAIKKQLGYDTKRQANAMIDTIFCVENPLEWHTANLHRNWSHYSGVRRLGGRVVSHMQICGGARVYFNTLVPWNRNGGLMKYGIVSKCDLLDDLRNWTHLYLAGRLQKPIETLYGPDTDVQRAQQQNLQNAIRTSLLMLPEQFTAYELFHTVSNLSYAGDFRMIFGENKQKVHNIVSSQLADFQQVYAETLRDLQTAVQQSSSSSSEQFVQNHSPAQRLQHLRALPNALQTRISRLRESADPADFLTALSMDPAKTQRIVQKCCRQIVWSSSVWQSLKNIPTAGFVKSLRYSWQKALKTFAS